MDLSEIIEKFSIELPNEEFAPEPFNDELVSVPIPDPPVPLISLSEQIIQELDHLQELIELIEDTADDFTATIPPELEFLSSTLNTAQYLEIKRSRNNASRPLVNQFDRSLISGCGLPNAWPVLTLDPLRALQDSLTQTLQVIQGQLYQPTLDSNPYRNYPSGRSSTTNNSIPSDWEVTATKYLNQLAITQISTSTQYRGKFAITVASMGSSLSNGLLEYFFKPALQSDLNDIVSALHKVRDILVKVRQMLCVGMALQALRLLAVRDAFQRILRAIIQQAIVSQLAVLFNKTLDTVVNSLLSTFESHSDDKQDIGDLVGDVVAEQLSFFLADAVQNVTGYSNRLVASVIRQSQEQSRKALSELSLLEHRVRVSRWIQHMDQGIILCNTLISGIESGNLLRGAINQFISSSIVEPSSKLYQRMKTHPQYENAFRGDINTSPYISRIS